MDFRWLLLLSLLLGGCSDGPEDVYQRAKEAKEKKDLKAYYECFTDQSAKSMKKLVAIQKRHEYLKDPFELLPSGEVVGEPKFEKRQGEEVKAILKVKEKTKTRTLTHELTFIREGEEWKIHVFQLPRYWLMRGEEDWMLDKPVSKGGGL